MGIIVGVVRGRNDGNSNKDPILETKVMTVIGIMKTVAVEIILKGFIYFYRCEYLSQEPPESHCSNSIRDKHTREREDVNNNMYKLYYYY